MVVREIPYTCTCCQAKLTVRSGENRPLPRSHPCNASSCPSCNGPCTGSAAPFAI